MKKIIITAILGALTFSGCGVYSEGEKIGQITSIQESGIFCKTTEVTIVRGGFNNGNGVNGQISHFTVENNPELVKVLTSAMNNNQEIKVSFRQEFISLCRSDSDNIFAKEATTLDGKPLKIENNSSKMKEENIQKSSTKNDSIQNQKEQKLTQEQIEQIAIAVTKAVVNSNNK